MDNPPAVARQQSHALTTADLMPAFDIQLAIERRNAITQFVKELMKEDVDFGKIPGVDKPTLLKPGAEKLVTFFGLSPEFTLEDRVEDWTGKDHGKEAFFYYRYRCRLTRGGRLIGEGEGSCNSWESKYRYRWAPESALPAGTNKERLQVRDSSITEFEFAIQKAETSGPYGKPAAYWQRFKDALAAGLAQHTTRKTKAGKEMAAISIPSILYRVPNPDVADQVNTMQKMGQKRSLVAAVLVGVNASEFFTQDVEDMTYIDLPAEAVRHVKEDPKAPAPQQRGSADEPSEPAAAPAPKTKKGAAKPPASTPPASTTPEMTNEEADNVLAFKECTTLEALTGYFNKLPADKRRPGTKIFDAFKKRRAELGAPE